MKKINLAIVGATGLVGKTFLKVLEEKDIAIKNLYLFASKKSEGQIILFKGKEYKVHELNEKNIDNKKIDFALFSAGGMISKKFAPIFKEKGITVIDNSSAWRMEKDVPLVVPQVNGEELFWHNKIIANPNCSTIACMAPLKALDEAFKLKSVSFATYQAVSGSGQKGINDFCLTEENCEPKFYPYKIFNNCLPHIDSFEDNGYTKEEMKMVNETKKILKLKKLKVIATCVRVPVLNCHSVSVVAKFKKKVDLQKARDALKNFKSIVLVDDVKNNLYPMPIIANCKDEVFVGRLRKDLFDNKTLTFFSVIDNLRKGAASNAIEILEYLIENEIS